MTSLPFEIQCIEAMLTTVIAVHRKEFDRLFESCTRFLEALSGSRSASLLTTKQQERLRDLKEGVVGTLRRIQSCSQLLQDLLEDDNQMSFLSLTEFAENPKLYESYNMQEDKAAGLRNLRMQLSASRQEDLEFILEFHLVECQELENRVALILKKLENAEQSVLVRLNVSQNELLVANTVVTITACAVGFGGYISGLFGMNLDQTIYLQPQSGSFKTVVIASFTFIVGSVILTLFYLRLTGVLPSHMKEKPVGKNNDSHPLWTYLGLDSGKKSGAAAAAAAAVETGGGGGGGGAPPRWADMSSGTRGSFMGKGKLSVNPFSKSSKIADKYALP